MPTGFDLVKNLIEAAFPELMGGQIQITLTFSGTLEANYDGGVFNQVRVSRSSVSLRGVSLLSTGCWQRSPARATARGEACSAPP